MSSQERLQKIRERAQRRTPGAWQDEITDEGWLHVIAPDSPYADGVVYSVCGVGDLEDTEAADHANAEFIAHAPADIDYLLARCAALMTWVNDLQSGMYVNCVYCGHRYGPGETTPVSMADALKAHIEQCPDHPMSKLKAENAQLRAQLGLDVDYVPIPSFFKGLLNFTDGRIACPQCGLRDTSLMQTVETIEFWHCDNCHYSWYMKDGLVQP